MPHDTTAPPLAKPPPASHLWAMPQPIDVAIPHKLGREEARRRIGGNLDKLQRHIPGGAAVTSNWVGDRLDLGITALGQTLDAAITVEDAQVRVHIDLPGMLALFAAPIEAALKAKGPELLEDHSKH